MRAHTTARDIPTPPQDQEGRLGLVSGLILAIVAALAAFLFLTLAAVPPRTFVFVMLILAGLLGLVILRNIKQFLLGLLVAGTGIGLDFHFVYQYSAQFHSSNGFFFHIVFFPLGILYLRMFWKIFQGEESFGFRRKGLIPLALFVIFAVLSATFAPLPEFSYYELFTLSQCLLVYLLMTEQFKKRTDLFTFSFALAAAVGFQGLLALVQYVTGSGLGLEFFGEADRLAWEAQGSYGMVRRASGTLGYPNSLAQYLDMLLPIVFGLALMARKPLLKAALWGAAGFGMIGMVATVSRGGILAAITTLFAVTCYAGTRKRQLARHVIVYIMVIAIALGILLFSNTSLADRLFQSGDSSAQSRLPMMDVATRMIAGYALTGVGLNNYTNVAPGYDYTISRISMQFPYPVHNIFLLILAEVGIFAFAAMVIFLLTLLVKGIALSRDTNPDIGVIGFGLMTGLIGYLLHGLVDYDYITANFTFWVVAGSLVGIWQLRRTATGPAVPETE